MKGRPDLPDPTGPPIERVLVVDGEPAARLGVRDYLRSKGLDVAEADSCGSAEESVRACAPDAVVLDDRLPDGDALALLPRLKSADPELPVVILTGQGTLERGVQAIQSGADQFLPKPVTLGALLVLLQRLLRSRRDRRRQNALMPRSRVLPDPFLGTSAAIRELESEARAALGSAHPILIEGETGAGKGVLAEWLHQKGPRGQEAFVDLHCAGLARDLLEAEVFGYEPGAFRGAIAKTPGLFEIAHHGTVFLDEIGAMDLEVQAKLLEVIEERRLHRLGDSRVRSVDVHLVVATQRDLLALAREKRFREDLYYRIGVIPLRVPALRERPEDVPLLARAVLDEFTIETGRDHGELEPDAAQELAAYPWPGNVRELRNTLERAALRAAGGPITRAALSLDAPRETPMDTELNLREQERRLIERALQAEHFHVARAAKRLGVPRSTLYQRLRQMGITTRRAP